MKNFSVLSRDVQQEIKETVELLKNPSIYKLENSLLIKETLDTLKNLLDEMRKEIKEIERRVK